MEKFGIFELLDALSAITAKTDGETPEERPNAHDKAFSPPGYGTDPSSQNAEEPTKPADAYGAFLSRHDAISKQIDRRKD